MIKKTFIFADGTDYDPEEAIENPDDTSIDEAETPNSELDGDFFEIEEAEEVEETWADIDLDDYKEDTK